MVIPTRFIVINWANLKLNIKQTNSVNRYALYMGVYVVYIGIYTYIFF